MGVWIEIGCKDQMAEVTAVAPFVGVWIEIQIELMLIMLHQSLPSWECGLKLMEKQLQLH